MIFYNEAKLFGKEICCRENSKEEKVDFIDIKHFCDEIVFLKRHIFAVFYVKRKSVE